MASKKIENIRKKNEEIIHNKRYVLLMKSQNINHTKWQFVYERIVDIYIHFNEIILCFNRIQQNHQSNEAQENEKIKTVIYTNTLLLFLYLLLLLQLLFVVALFCRVDIIILTCFYRLWELFSTVFFFNSLSLYILFSLLFSWTLLVCVVKHLNSLSKMWFNTAQCFWCLRRSRSCRIIIVILLLLSAVVHTSLSHWLAKFFRVVLNLHST